MEYNSIIGKINANKEDIISFYSGLPGFENLKDFVLLSFPENEPIKWLVSLEDEGVVLPVIDPWVVRKDYFLDIDDEYIKLLEINNKEKLLIMSILRIPNDNPKDITVNLVAPLIINLENNRGMQILLDSQDYRIRHSVKEELKRSENLVIKKGEKDKNADT